MSRRAPNQHRTASKPFRQPKDALTPSAFTLETAEKWALQKSRTLPADQFRIRGFWYINYVWQPAPEERKRRYTIKLAQSEGYGRSCGLTPVLPDPDPDFVGKDARQLLRDGLCRDDIDRTALIDLIMATFLDQRMRPWNWMHRSPQNMLLGHAYLPPRPTAFLGVKGLRL
jgi:hypothetical protein